MEDKEKLESMGIVEGVLFELRELTGVYTVFMSNRRVCEIKGNAHYVVAGLYENLLKGKYHKKG